VIVPSLASGDVCCTSHKCVHPRGFVPQEKAWPRNLINVSIRLSQTALWSLTAPWGTALQSCIRLWRDCEHAKMSCMLEMLAG